VEAGDDFARQLDLLQETHDVVSLESALAPAPEPARDSARPRVAITFDDAYRGAVHAGVEELAARGMPATIFVAPAFVDGGTFWWDALAGETGLSDEVRTHALEHLQGKDARVRAWAAERGLRESHLPEHQSVAREEELSEATRTPGITLASHTWSHPNLSALDPEDLEAEVVRPQVWLRERFPHVVPWITYPYGLFSPAVEAAAARAGYRGGFRVSGGWLRGGTAPSMAFALPRLNIPAGLSPRGFELRAAGLLSR